MKKIKKIVTGLIVVVLLSVSVNLPIYAEQGLSQQENKTSLLRASTESTLLFKYVNKYGEELGQQQVTGKKGASKLVIHSYFDGYMFIKPENYTLPDEDKTVEILLEYDTSYLSWLRIIPVDESGKQLTNPVLITGENGSTTDVQYPKIKGYKAPQESFTHRFKYAPYEYQPDEMKVVYEQIPSTVTIDFYDEISNESIITVTKQFFADPSKVIQIPFPEVPGYGRYSDSISLIIAGDHSVRIPYYRKDININVNYVLENGVPIQTQMMSSLYLDPYEIELEAFDAYNVVSVDTNGFGLVGTTPPENQTFTVTLKLKTITNTVVFHDDQGNEIYTTEVTGNYGETVEVKAPEIAGYDTSSLIETVTFKEQGKVIQASSVAQRKPFTILVEYITKAGNVIQSRSFTTTFLDAYAINIESVVGYKFDKILDDRLLSGTMPAEDFKIQILLEEVLPDTYQVVFDTQEGSAVETQSVEAHQKVVKPQDPVKDQYHFAGWYLDPEMSEAWNFDTPVTQDTILYAKWMKHNIEKPIEPANPTEPTSPVTSDKTDTLPKSESQTLPATGLSNNNSFMIVAVALVSVGLSFMFIDVRRLFNKLIKK
ncbi:MucBP domain-containing protein [Erysipelothrix anatis]|uniref:MucBP domain-containing protein n=1 Tax=Erysipelothrix anatis TaxID=2683713 RepID=UPI00135CC38A|nr:InlB B-repeat-containing protein [Erysipelothrix anatis]